MCNLHKIVRYFDLTKSRWAHEPDSWITSHLSRRGALIVSSVLAVAIIRTWLRSTGTLTGPDKDVSSTTGDNIVDLL